MKDLKQMDSMTTPNRIPVPAVSEKKRVQSSGKKRASTGRNKGRR